MDIVEAQTPEQQLGPNPEHPNRVTVDKLKVLHDYLVVRPLAVPSKLAGSRIHMADTAAEREKSHRGIVLKTGPGDFNEPGTALVPMTIESGDLVFFGKYAGTEERIGMDVVLVMREQECRFCVPEGRYELVEHEDPRLDHLVEDYCDVCHGVPEEEAAKQRLELAREAHQLNLRNGDVQEPEAQPSAPREFPVLDRRVAELDEANEQLGDLLKKGKLNPEPVLVDGSRLRVLELSEDRRPCCGPHCLLMQRKLDTNAGLFWIGLRCGHVSPAEGMREL